MKDRRTQIIEAATAVMVRQGFGDTSIDEVIRESGLCGKGHFYHYFKSKEELGYAVLKLQFESFAERGLTALREPTRSSPRSLPRVAPPEPRVGRSQPRWHRSTRAFGSW